MNPPPAEAREAAGLCGQPARPPAPALAHGAALGECKLCRVEAA